VVEGLPQEALMNPAFSSGERRLPTTLDRALLRDVGWVEALPSDANLDGRFDFEDLVQIFSTGGPKYSDGDNQNTTWDEGDFDDDFDFEFEDLILAFGTYGQYYGDPLPYGAEESLAEQGGEAAAEVALVYDARSGNLALESGGNQLSTIAIESAGEMLLASAESQSLLGGLADVNSSEIFGKLDPSGISDLDFGAALPAGLTRAMLADDLTVNGSLVGGGFVGGYSLVYVPEPGTLALAFAGLILLLLWKQRYA